MTTKEFASRNEIAAWQLAAINRLLPALRERNSFYSSRLSWVRQDPSVGSLDEFAERVEFATKEELVKDHENHPPFGSHWSCPVDEYVYFHQTSGTAGPPMIWLDTRDSWDWMVNIKVHTFEVAGVRSSDRLFFPFSFGPYLGFWTAWAAAERMGCLCISGGGMSSEQRLNLIRRSEATVICCTPTYALRLAEMAGAMGTKRGHRENRKVRILMLGGEPGASIPATRDLLQTAWKDAEIFDHHGLTEIGPVSYQDPRHPGVLFVNESAYFAEVVDPKTLKPVQPGQTGELVLTTLGRDACPLLRYRTGDLVRPNLEGPGGWGRAELALEGGILGRIDDMVVIRGVNIYPAAIENVVRSFPELEEFQVRIDRTGAMPEMQVLVELKPTASANVPLAVESNLREVFNLRIPVRQVAGGSLPRAEGKAQRWIQIRPLPGGT